MVRREETECVVVKWKIRQRLGGRKENKHAKGGDRGRGLIKGISELQNS